MTPLNKISSVLIMISIYFANSNARNIWELQNGNLAGKVYCSITFTGTQYVVVGDSGKIATSPDAKIWTPRTSGTKYGLNCIIWNGQLLASVGERGIRRIPAAWGGVLQ
jgi:hypothetical protein